LNIKAAHAYKTSVNILYTRWRHIPDYNIRSLCSKKCKIPGKFYWQLTNISCCPTGPISCI